MPGTVISCASPQTGTVRPQTVRDLRTQGPQLPNYLPPGMELSSLTSGTEGDRASGSVEGVERDNKTDVFRMRLSEPHQYYAVFHQRKRCDILVEPKLGKMKSAVEDQSIL